MVKFLGDWIAGEWTGDELRIWIGDNELMQNCEKGDEIFDTFLDLGVDGSGNASEENKLFSSLSESFNIFCFLGWIWIFWGGID